MMKKKGVFAPIVVALAVVLVTAGPVVAKSKKKIKSEGCRVTPPLFAGDVTCPGGTPITNPDGVNIFPFCSEDGRWHARNMQMLWNICGGNDFVHGTAFFDLNVNCDGPPPAGPITGHCRMWGSFELIPDAYCNEWGEQWGELGAEADVCVDARGSWMGSFESIYHNGIQERRIDTHGTGDLKGLELTSYDVIDLAPPGNACVAGGSIPFTWRFKKSKH
jgi:hypothetical protein